MPKGEKSAVPRRKSLGKNFPYKKQPDNATQVLLDALPELKSFDFDKDDLCLYAASVINKLKADNMSLKEKVDIVTQTNSRNSMQYAESLVKANVKVQYLQKMLKKHVPAMNVIEESVAVEPHSTAAADYTHFRHYCNGLNMCVQCEKKILTEEN